MPPLAALTAVSCAVTAVAGRAALQPTSLLAGFAFGCHWSLMPVRHGVRVRVSMLHPAHVGCLVVVCVALCTCSWVMGQPEEALH